MSEQVFICGYPVNASISMDDDGVTRVVMSTEDVDVRMWARVSRSAGFQVVYQYIGSGMPLDCICVDYRGSYRGIYGYMYCTVYLGKEELFE